MNQLFNNVAGGIEHQIRREKRTTISEVIVRVKRNIMQNRNFLLKVRVLYLTILKRKNLSLPLKVEQTSLSFVWFYQCLSVIICCISPSNSEANRDGADAESPFPLFFSFSASFKHSNPRERSENCLRFRTDDH